MDGVRTAEGVGEGAVPKDVLRWIRAKAFIAETQENTDPSAFIAAPEVSALHMPSCRYEERLQAIWKIYISNCWATYARYSTVDQPQPLNTRPEF